MNLPIPFVRTVIDRDGCPNCNHTWHGLLCADRGVMTAPGRTCRCRGSITQDELDELLDTDV